MKTKNMTTPHLRNSINPLPWRYGFFLIALALAALALLTGSIAQAQIKAGDILVLDDAAYGHGALFLVNPATGDRTVLSDFSNPAQGSLGQAPTGVAVGTDGQIFVSDLFAGTGFFGGLFGVDPDTGNRTLLSDFGQGAIQGNLYYGLAVDAKGRVIADLLFGPAGSESQCLSGCLVSVDPKTDERVIVSDLQNPAQGPILSVSMGFVFSDLTLEKSGKILIGTQETDETILRVHPVTGKRRLLSDFANPAQGADVGDSLILPGLAVEASGTILVASYNMGLLLRVDPKTGVRTILSDFNNPAQGVVACNIIGDAVEDSGQILVFGISPCTSFSYGVLFRVDPSTGQRTILSDFNNPAQGPSGSAVEVYIAVVPDSDDEEETDR
jgi:hypothetical protein